MQNLYNFLGIENCERIIKVTWSQFRLELANKKFRYNEIDAALKTTFLHVFDDLFVHGHSLLEKKVIDALSPDSSIMRAAHIKDGDPDPDYNRFIPTAKYITTHNRFSPPGMEWLYLAIGPGNDCGTGFSIAEKCALKECRASAGDHYALCSFKPTDAYKDKKVVDLTIAKDYSFDEINAALEQRSQQIYKREISRVVASRIITGKAREPKTEDLKPAIERWIVYTYARLLSEQIFLPITTEDREIMYAPFQCVAQYFLSRGYVGIVFSSTVFPEGKNIVLFDKQAAEPYNPIKSVIVSDKL